MVDSSSLSRRLPHNDGASATANQGHRNEVDILGGSHRRGANRQGSPRNGRPEFYGRRRPPRRRSSACRLRLPSPLLMVLLVLATVQILTVSLLLLHSGVLPWHLVESLPGDFMEAYHPKYMPGLSYNNPSVLLGGCRMTVVLPLWLHNGKDDAEYEDGEIILHAALRRRPLLAVNKEIIRSLESALANVRLGGLGESCLLVQTLPSFGECRPSDGGEGTNSKNVARALRHKSSEGSELRRWIARGTVRVSELDVGKYAKEIGGCDGGTYDFDYGVNKNSTLLSRPVLPIISNDAVLLSWKYWSDEFVWADSDRVLMVPPGKKWVLPPETVLCRPLHLSGPNVSAWSNLVGKPVSSQAVDWAYLAAPGRVLEQETCSKPPQLWSKWHNHGDSKDEINGGSIAWAIPPYPTEEELCSNPTLFPIDGGSVLGGPSLRSRKWMMRAIEYCPHVDLSGLSPRKVASAGCRLEGGVEEGTDPAPPEGLYFSTLLRGMAHGARAIRSGSRRYSTFDGDPPSLPTLFEASLFATIDELPDLSAAGHFSTGRKDVMDQASLRMWDKGKILGYFLMGQQIRSVRSELKGLGAGGLLDPSMEFPVALFEPWKHLDPYFLFSQYLIERCLDLRTKTKSPPIEESTTRKCSDRLQHRRCSRSTNVSGKLSGNIVYFSLTRRAGMRDVRSVLQQLGNFAASLCARLVLRPPGQMLDWEKHNEGVRIPDAFPHSDYVDVTSVIHWIDEGEHNFLDGGTKPVILDYVTIEEAREYGNSEDVDVHIETDGSNAGTVFDQYMRALDAVDAGQTVVWGIDKSVYELRDQFMKSAITPGVANMPFFNTSFPLPHLNHRIRGCNYVDMKPSVKQERAVSAFLDRAGIASSEGVTYTPLHIRRGDLTHKCNSSLAALESYLECSYSLCPPLPSSGNHLASEGRKPIILFTNEKDPTYIASVLKLLRTYAPGSLHGDSLLSKILHPKGLPSEGRNVSREVTHRRRGDTRDNFFLFSVADVIMKKVPAEKRLVRHRNQCNACDHMCEEKQDPM